MFDRNSSENLLKKIVKLDTVEFLGVCKILGIKLYEVEESQGEKKDDKTLEPKAREFTDIWCDLCDKVESLNRVRRKNLGRLVSAATKKEKKSRR